MNTTVKKNVITRFIAVIFAIFLAAFMFAFTTLTSADAADIKEVPTRIETIDNEKLDAMPMELLPIYDIEATPLADEDDDDADDTAASSGSADSAYTSVVNFFVKWIRRVGALIAFIGAVMFALAIKNNEPDQKERGVLTMVAGFVVIAVCTAVDMFDLFA